LLFWAITSRLHFSKAIGSSAAGAALSAAIFEPEPDKGSGSKDFRSNRYRKPTPPKPFIRF